MMVSKGPRTETIAAESPERLLVWDVEAVQTALERVA